MPPARVLLSFVLALGALFLRDARAPAVTPPPPSLALTMGATETGWISLAVGQAGDPVTVSEVLPDGTEVSDGTFAPTDGSVARRHFVPWVCDRQTRTFVARDAVSGQEARATVTTPDCSHRLTLRALSRHPRAGGSAGVSLVDAWGVGAIKARVCARPAGRARTCRRIAIAAGQASAAFSVRAPQPGPIAFTAARQGVVVGRVRLRVAHRAGTLRLLATGDSMIQVLDDFLAERLHGVRVTKDAHISTGISKLGMYDWLKAAAREAGAVHPDVTVLFLGANDGFPMKTPSGGTAACCGDAWVREYARRERVMLRAYLRGGRGRVYVLLLATPAKASFAAIYRQVDKAEKLAAASFPGQVSTIDLGRTFSPGGRYRASISGGGRPVRVRQADGNHLNGTGASIAADIVIARMRRDGVV